MINTKLSQLKEITDLRTVWPHEAIDFTPWLAQEENIALLSDATGIDITVIETESNVGSFSTDILGTETDTGHTIIIENQLEDTNHDHLGKIITYAAGKNASYIIWIVKHAREEHKAAIEWLNAHTDDDVGFFLCEVKLYQIDTSNLAPKFVTVEVPNDWSKATKATNDSISQNERDRLAYWTSLNDYAFQNSAFAKEFRKHKPSRDHWYTLSIGTSKAQMSFLRLKARMSVSVEFYIDNNKEFYDSLFEHKVEIEQAAGMQFSWQRLDSKKASRISIEKAFPIDDESDWNNEFDWMMEVAIKMKKAFLNFV
ncbi:DUF4268 domain-containing protein [Pygmaiobacter massiliensis]|uniref:DUF4268 domain-containing protein n=1 Tax=Pygmaiobacter massiliensis TaxID=1917873 RepID=UPI00289C034A|nr:DUF4268 domain-containing protein [Pygmaiobacter massiliensis]